MFCIFTISNIFNITSEENNRKLIIETLKTSLSVSGMLCGLQYIQRLYKACIAHRIVGNITISGRMGNIMYFVIRPICSFAFVIVMIFALLSGMYIVTGNLDYVINEKFLYLCVIFSSFIGYSIGRVLDKFGIISNKQIENIK